LGGGGGGRQKEKLLRDEKKIASAGWSPGMLSFLDRGFGEGIVSRRVTVCQKNVTEKNVF